MLEEIRKNMIEAMKIAKRLLIEEYKGQGHVNTGALINSIEERIIQEGTKVIGELMIFDYALYLERRTPPNRIPFKRGSGAGTSKFIEGLRRFWETKGLSGREALGAAFATATKMKQEGRPTQRSLAFSTNGRRTGAIEYAFKPENIADIEDLFISEELIAIYSSNVTEAFKAAA